MWNRALVFSTAILIAASTIVKSNTAAGQETSSDSHTEESDFEPAEEDVKGIFGLAAAPIDDNIVTDRPSFTTGTETVPWGRFQIEAGYTFTYDREKDERARRHTMPELLGRLGIVENFEFRFGWNGYSYSELNSTADSSSGRHIGLEEWEQGSFDINLEFKLKFAEQDGLLPNLSLLGGVTIPTGSSVVSSGDVDPSLSLLWSYQLNENTNVAGSVVFAVPTVDSVRYFETSASIIISVALTDRLGSFFEYYGIYPGAIHNDCAHTLDGGFTYLITNNFQVDVRAGFGLNEQPDDFFTGVGFGWRF